MSRNYVEENWGSGKFKDVSKIEKCVSSGIRAYLHAVTHPY